jgi:hypothetical protein
MTEVPQSVERMTPRTARCTRRIQRRTDHPRGDEVFASHVLNAVPRFSERGFMLEKSKSRAKIDGGVALALAYDQARTGDVNAYRPINPDSFLEQVKRVNGRGVFTYKDADGDEADRSAPSGSPTSPARRIDGTRGIRCSTPPGPCSRPPSRATRPRSRPPARHPARRDRDPGDGEDDFDDGRGRGDPRGAAGEGARRGERRRRRALNRKLKLEPGPPVEHRVQWHETRQDVLGEIERLFGMPPHLLNDTEKQTSWGTGVAEQNLGLARFTLMGWSTASSRCSRSASRGPVRRVRLQGPAPGHARRGDRARHPAGRRGLLIDLDEATRGPEPPAAHPEQKAASRAPRLPRLSRTANEAAA